MHCACVSLFSLDSGPRHAQKHTLLYIWLHAVYFKLPCHQTHLVLLFANSSAYNAATDYLELLPEQVFLSWLNVMPQPVCTNWLSVMLQSASYSPARV